MIWLKDKRIWILLGFYGVLAILFHMCWLKLGGGDDYYFMTGVGANCVAVVRIFLQRLWETWKWQQYPDRQKHFVWDSDGCPAYIPDSVPLPPPFL